MICEGKDPDYEDIIRMAEFKMPLRCEHDFWPHVNFTDYGDVLLCQRCNQYFTKIKHIPWIIKSKELPAGTVKGCGKITIKPKPNHKTEDVWVRVPVRISTDE
jgi:hypothetical protein